MESKEDSIEVLQANVLDFPLNLDNYKKLIRELRLQEGDNLEDILAVRRAKLQYFILPPGELNEWMEDLNAIGDDNTRIVSKINFFRDVISDYPISEYWVAYINYVSEIVNESSELIDEAALAALIDQAISQAVYDYNNESLWALAFKYHTKNYEKLKTPESLEKLKSLHLERLSMCHKTIDESFSEYSKFSSEYFSNQYETEMTFANKVYSKTKKKQRYIDQYEVELEQDPANKATWITYLENVYSFSNDVNEMTMIFWRSLIQGNSSIDHSREWVSVWLTYVYHLYGKEVSGDYLEPVLAKFIRNYPTSPIPYAEYIRCCEIFEDPLEKFVNMRDHIKAIDFLKTSDYNQWEVLVLSILTFELRVLRETKDPNFIEHFYRDATNYVDIALKHKNIFHAVEKMCISSFEELQDVDQARLIVNQMLDISPDQCEVWLFAIDFERRNDCDYNRISKLFESGVSRGLTLDWPERLLQEWLNFEQIHGTYFSHRSALLKANNIYKDISATKLGHNQDASKKRELSGEEDEPIQKKAKQELEPKRSRENFSVKVLNLPINISESKVRDFFADCGTIKSFIMLEENDSTSAVLEFTKEQEVFASLTKDKKRIENRPVQVARMLQCTLWVANFPPSWTATKLKQFFEKAGKLVDVRMPSQDTKKTRRFSYVEYMRYDDAQRAIEEYSGREVEDEASNRQYKLVVKFSDPPSIKKSQNSNHREIYVSNLDFKKVDEKALEDFFRDCGTIEKITLPLSKEKERLGLKNNGFGFVRFIEITAVSKAMALNNQKLLKRPVHIQHVFTNKQDPNSFDDQNTISISNLRNTVSSEQLRIFLESKIGPVARIEVYSKISMALVEFKNTADSGKASLALDNTELEGNLLATDSKMSLIKTLNGEDRPSVKRTMVPPSLMRRR